MIYLIIVSSLKIRLFTLTLCVGTAVLWAYKLKERGAL